MAMAIVVRMALTAFLLMAIIATMTDAHGAPTHDPFKELGQPIMLPDSSNKISSTSSRSSSTNWWLGRLFSSSSSSSSSNGSGVRRLLQSQTDQICSPASRELLSNGAFVTEQEGLGDLINVLIAATMSNDAYPFAREFGFTIMDVVPGLSKEQVAEYQRKFTAKYSRLGASSVRFADYYSPDGTAAAHAIVIGTHKDVFLVFRGTADLGQVWTSANISAATATVFGVTMELYQAPYRSVQGVIPEVLEAVSQAVAATDDPASARVFAAGHSLGGASACFSSLLLKEQGFQIGGVYNFGGYKMGKACAPNEQCWVTLYDKHLGDVTWFWWHGQDPIPLLVDAALGTTFANSNWGHVPSSKHWMRIAGDTCFEAPPNQECPPLVDASDGTADGVCSHTIVQQHMPWIYLQKVARCALLQDGSDATTPPPAGQQGGGGVSSQRLDDCQQTAVWTALLGFSEVPQLPGGAAGAAAVSGGVTSGGQGGIFSSLVSTFMRRAGPSLAAAAAAPANAYMQGRH